MALNTQRPGQFFLHLRPTNKEKRKKHKGCDEVLKLSKENIWKPVLNLVNLDAFYTVEQWWTTLK